MLEASPPTPDAPARNDAPPQELELELVPSALPVGTPLMMGLIAAVLAMDIMGAAAPDAGRLGSAAVGLVAGFSQALLALFLLRRQQADRVRVTEDGIALCRGDRTLRKVLFERLSEVGELKTASGRVLLLSDHRQTLALADAAYVRGTAPTQIDEALLAAMQRVDPSGNKAREAVTSGRRREAIAQQPVRGTPALAAVVGFASLLAFGLEQSLKGRPYPSTAAGALSIPLVEAGEYFRLLSYVFQHVNGMHLVVSIAGLLWLGAYLEKMLGWERVLIAFVAGAIGGAAGHAVQPLPVAAHGATAGLFGLFGLLAATVIIGRKRLPRALVPRPLFWVITVFLGLLLPFSLSVDAIIPSITWLSHLGGLLAGVVVGILTVLGQDLPVSDDARHSVRPFGILAAAALGLSLVGGVTHIRKLHPDDDEIVTRALLASSEPEKFAEFGPTLSALVIATQAQQLNTIAYTMLIAPKAGPDAFDHADRLASAAVELTNRHSPEILDTLAVARYRQGRTDDARELLEEALKMDTYPALKQVLERRLRDVNGAKELTPDDVPIP